MKKDKPLESWTENKFKSTVESMGDIYLKITTPSGRGWPDRLILMDDGIVLWMEFKREGEDLRKKQRYIHKELIRRRHIVHTVDTFEEAFEVYSEVCCKKVPR